MTFETTGEKQFRLLADNAPVMIWRSDLTMGCDFLNKPWLDFTGRSLDDELGAGWTRGLHPDDRERCLAVYRNAFARREKFSIRYRVRRADGAWRWILDNGQPYFDASGEFAGYFGSCIDVTDLIGSHDELAAAYDEKDRLLAQRDLLLHEVQHRVRNNLQLILSILDLQGRHAEPLVRDALDAVAGRVRSIAKAQSLVIDPTEGADIDFTEYVAALSSSVASLTARGRVEIRASGVPSRMRLSRAVPLGLTLNELLANTAQHAFPDGASGVIDVTLRRVDGALALCIDSQGAGDGVARALDSNPTMGMKLIRRLAAQADARVEAEDGEGAHFRIVIPETP